MVMAAISVRLEMTMLPLWISTQRLPDDSDDWEGCASERAVRDTKCLVGGSHGYLSSKIVIFAGNMDRWVAGCCSVNASSTRAVVAIEIITRRRNLQGDQRPTSPKKRYDTADIKYQVRILCHTAAQSSKNRNRTS